MSAGEVRTTADLREYLDAIDLCYFDRHLEELGVEIRWMPARKAPQPDKVGHYIEPDKTIELARNLAHPDVPRQYVMSVIYHEALHAIYGPGHERQFQLAERQFLFLYEAYEWERQGGPWPPAPKGLR